MVEPRYYGYDYGTSPRKTDPIPQKRDVTKKTNSANKKVLTKKQNNKSGSKKKKELELKKQKIKMIVYLVICFSVLFTISYRYSLIDEEFDNLSKIKGQLTSLQKENGKIKLSIENAVNLSNIEKLAIEKLGMQKLDKSQIVYMELDNRDYVENEVPSIIETEEGIIEKVKKGIFNGF